MHALYFGHFSQEHGAGWVLRLQDHKLIREYNFRQNINIMLCIASIVRNTVSKYRLAN